MMHVTLHLTTGCNMDCAYCYSPPRERRDMEAATLRRAVEFATEICPTNAGLVYFGGEPLLRKDLILEGARHARDIEKRTGRYVHQKLTTNGLLLDREFLEAAREHRIEVALSLDGVRQAHDTHRRAKGGAPTFDLVDPKADLLLEYQPYAKVLTTVTPSTLRHYADSFEALVERGFRYVVASLDLSADWTDSDVSELAEQYRRIARIYERFVRQERKFYFSPFEMKFASRIRSEGLECLECHLGKRQISIAPNGDVYPCSQFVKDGTSNTTYRIGDVVSGIDAARQEALYRESKDPDPACRGCDLLPRCNNKCGCLNWQLTGIVNKVSPKLCECERALFRAADSLGEKLWRDRRGMFVQKHYNKIYPILSMTEDHP